MSSSTQSGVNSVSEKGVQERPEAGVGGGGDGGAEVRSQPDTIASLSTGLLAMLVEIGDEINASLDLDEVLSRCAALIKRLIPYEIFAVLLVDERTRELYFRFDIGHKEEVTHTLRVPLGQGITGTAAEDRRAVRVDDVREFAGYINALDTVRSELAVPLLLHGRCIGVVDIQSDEPAAFTSEQQNILSLLASRLAVAIENARLFEHTSEQAELMRVLHEVIRETSSILDTEELLRRAAELTKRVIDYQIFNILLYDERTNSFLHRVTVKFGEQVQQKFAVPAGEGIVGACAAQRQPVLVSDVRNDPRYLEMNPETRSELSIPMIYSDRVVGVLDLESPQLNYFTPEHVRTLSVLAGHLAVALENARLYEQVARDEARMERELQAARQLQGALLPAPPSEDYGVDIAARYTAARELGGDLYDFLRYDPQQVGVAVGDVSGKGTAAALYGAVAFGILRSLTRNKYPPAEVLRRLNLLVGERKVEGRFMTLCYATWHKRHRILRVANAGQSQPLLWMDGRCQKLDLTGLPLGIYEDVKYDEWSARLRRGDIVVFYSDGFTESANMDGELFGLERLRELLCQHHSASAGELADIMIDAVDEFVECCPAADDRTLVIVKVR